MQYVDVVKNMYTNKDYIQLNNFIKEITGESSGIEKEILTKEIIKIVGSKYYKTIKLN